MAEPVEVEIFCEDVAQERFVAALVRRLAREAGAAFTCGACRPAAAMARR